MHGKVHGGQVGCAGLCLVAIRLNGAAYSAPDIDLVRQVKRNLKVVIGTSIGSEARRPIVGDLVSRGVGATAERWEISRPVVADQRTSLSILSLRRLQILVGDITLQFEGVQLRVLKHLPPVAAEILVVRLGLFPIAKLFVDRRNFRGGPLICWSHSASANLDYGHRGQKYERTHSALLSDQDGFWSTLHLLSPGNVA